MASSDEHGFEETSRRLGVLSRRLAGLMAEMRVTSPNHLVGEGSPGLSKYSIVWLTDQGKAANSAADGNARLQMYDMPLIGPGDYMEPFTAKDVRPNFNDWTTFRNDLPRLVKRLDGLIAARQRLDAPRLARIVDASWELVFPDSPPVGIEAQNSKWTNAVSNFVASDTVELEAADAAVEGLELIYGKGIFAFMHVRLEQVLRGLAQHLIADSDRPPTSKEFQVVQPAWLARPALLLFIDDRSAVGLTTAHVPKQKRAVLLVPAPSNKDRAEMQRSLKDRGALRRQTELADAATLPDIGEVVPKVIERLPSILQECGLQFDWASLSSSSKATSTPELGGLTPGE